MLRSAGLERGGVSKAFIVGESINGSKETPLLINLLCVALSGRADHILWPNWLKIEIWPLVTGPDNFYYWYFLIGAKKIFSTPCCARELCGTLFYYLESKLNSAHFLGLKISLFELIFVAGKSSEFSLFSWLENQHISAHFHSWKINWNHLFFWHDNHLISGHFHS